MTTEVELAAAWRARVATGETPDVVVVPAPGGWRVRFHGVRVADFRATYKAHAYAETLARKAGGEDWHDA